MSIKCLMNGLEVNYPCSPNCDLFGDCVTVFEAQKKANVRTNADRIRTMNDEELARFFSETFCNGYGKPQLAEWLQSHAEKEGE